MPPQRPQHAHTSSDSSEGKIYVSQARWKEIQETAYAHTRAETRKLMLTHFTHWDQRVQQDLSHPEYTPFSEVLAWLKRLPSSPELYIDLAEADWLNNGEIVSISFPFETLPTHLIYEQTAREIRALQLRELTQRGIRAGTAPALPPIVLRNDGNLYMQLGTAGLWERFHPLSPPPPLPTTPKKWTHKWGGVKKWFARRAPAPVSRDTDRAVTLSPSFFDFDEAAALRRQQDGRLERFSEMHERACALQTEEARAANDKIDPALLSDSARAAVSLRKYNRWRFRASKHGVPVLAGSRRQLCACHVCWPVSISRRWSGSGTGTGAGGREGGDGKKIRRWSWGV